MCHFGGLSNCTTSDNSYSLGAHFVINETIGHLDAFSGWLAVAISCSVSGACGLLFSCILFWRLATWTICGWIQVSRDCARYFLIMSFYGPVPSWLRHGVGTSRADALCCSGEKDASTFAIAFRHCIFLMRWVNLRVRFLVTKCSNTRANIRSFHSYICIDVILCLLRICLEFPLSADCQRCFHWFILWIKRVKDRVSVMECSVAVLSSAANLLVRLQTEASMKQRCVFRAFSSCGCLSPEQAFNKHACLCNHCFDVSYTWYCCGLRHIDSVCLKARAFHLAIIVERHGRCRHDCCTRSVQIRHTYSNLHLRIAGIFNWFECIFVRQKTRSCHLCSALNWVIPRFGRFRWLIRTGKTFVCRDAAWFLKARWGCMSWCRMLLESQVGLQSRFAWELSCSATVVWRAWAWNQCF